jgi:hypothetical protein
MFNPDLWRVIGFGAVQVALLAAVAILRFRLDAAEEQARMALQRQCEMNGEILNLKHQLSLYMNQKSVHFPQDTPTPLVIHEDRIKWKWMNNGR